MYHHIRVCFCEEQIVKSMMTKLYLCFGFLLYTCSLSELIASKISVGCANINLMSFFPFKLGLDRFEKSLSNFDLLSCRVSRLSLVYISQEFECT